MGIASGIETLELIDLTPFAVEARYDIELWPERAEAEAAVAIRRAGLYGGRTDRRLAGMTDTPAKRLRPGIEPVTS